MIATLHTEEFSCLAGLDHMARQGETLIVPLEPGDERSGTFEVVKVVHTVGSGRVACNDERPQADSLGESMRRALVAAFTAKAVTCNGPEGRASMNTFAEDIERLEGIAERILAGEPFEAFDLTPNEHLFVLSYTRTAVDQEFESEGTA